MTVRESELTTDYCECPSSTLILCHNKSAGGVYLQRARLVANFLMVDMDGYERAKGECHHKVSVETRLEQ
jgi:hypothetical protein